MAHGRALTFRVGEADGQGLGLGLTLGDVGGGVPHPAAVAADVGGELHVGNDWGSQGECGEGGGGQYAP